MVSKLLETGNSSAHNALPEPTRDYSRMSLEELMRAYQQACLKGNQRDMEQINIAIMQAVSAAANSGPEPVDVAPSGPEVDAAHTGPEVEREAESEERSKDDTVKAKSANLMRSLGADEEDESPGHQIGRGLLAVVTTPVALAGFGVYAAGLIVEGAGNILKGAGSLGKKAFVPPRRR